MDVMRGGNDGSAEPGQASDRVLVARVKAGDHAAYELLFRTYAQSLFRTAYNYVRTQDVAQDIVQDVMLSIWKNRERWEVTGSLQAYLQGATRTRALKVLVTEARTNRREDVFVLHSGTGGVSEPAAGPDSQTEAHELAAAIVNAVRELPEKYRRVLMLRTSEQMTYPEIATMLGLPLKTVKTQAQRGISRLKQALKPYFPNI